MLSLKLPEAEPIIFDVKDDPEKTNIFRARGFNRKRRDSSGKKKRRGSTPKSGNRKSTPGTPKNKRGQSGADTDG